MFFFLSFLELGMAGTCKTILAEKETVPKQLLLPEISYGDDVFQNLWVFLWLADKCAQKINHRCQIRKTSLYPLVCCYRGLSYQIGPLHDPVIWCTITHAETQVAPWDSQNKARPRWTGTSCFVLEVPMCNLLTSMCDFVPCDRIVQRAHWLKLRS